MDIRALSPADAAEFQSLRLSGLRECPTAFAASFEEECDLALSVVAERLQHRDDRAVFGAFQGNELTGLVGIRREVHQKLAHKAYVWGMYVAAHVRKQGVGSQLVASAKSYAVSDLRARQIILGVNATNEAAIALYQRMGFKAFGREPCFMLVEGVPQDEIQMVCFLRPAT